MRSRRSSSHRLTRNSRSRLFLLVRMIALVTALQLSGAIHAAGDVWSAVAGTAVASDCDEESAGKQCPAGCPNCHCVARTIVAPPQVIDVEALLTVDDSELTAVSVGVARSPQGPPQTAPYRPPRA